MTLKMAVLAPTPTAMVRTATAANAGFLANSLTAYFTSLVYRLCD